MTRRYVLPRPLRPINLKSLNIATRFLTRAEQLRSSAEQFSSLPALKDTAVPSGTSNIITTWKISGIVLLDRQCGGRALHKINGQPVRTNLPAYSTIISLTTDSKHQRLSAAFALCWCVDDVASPTQHGFSLWWFSDIWIGYI